ncbi:MAG: zinc ribbon domain-containing protein [Candidatus Cloacimonetes bacterium]|nr:zinc ribbon domain-containing protein [Candidatus Cloacimonadota bacterium]
MPTYEYECLSCGSVMEVFHSISASGPSSCDGCDNANLRRKIFAVSSIYKGDGFYSTQYRDSSYKEAMSRESGSSKEETASATPAPSGCGSGACGHKH